MDGLEASRITGLENMIMTSEILFTSEASNSTTLPIGCASFLGAKERQSLSESVIPLIAYLISTSTPKALKSSAPNLTTTFSTDEFSANFILTVLGHSTVPLFHSVESSPSLICSLFPP